MTRKQNWVNKLAWCALKSNLMRNMLIVSSTALLITSAVILFSVAFGLVQSAERPDYMLYTLRELVAPFHLMGRNAWGPLLNPVFILLPVLLCCFLLIYQCFCLSILKDIKTYALMMICGLTAKQKRALAVKQGLILWFFGVLAGFFLSLLVSFCVFPLIHQTTAPIGSEMVESDATFFWSPAAFFLSCLIALPVLLIGAWRAFGRLQNVSPAAALRSGASPLPFSLREMSTSASGAMLRSAKAGVRSWYIWNRLKRTKKYYLSVEGKQQAIWDGKKKQRQKLLVSSKISTSYARLSRLAFMNTLRSIRINYFVILSLCLAVLIFSLTHHLVFGLNPKAYTETTLENHDFVLINATCRVDYHDPDPPLLTDSIPQPVFTNNFLEKLQTKAGLTVSIIEVSPGSEYSDSSLKEITEQMIYKVNIDTDEAFLIETEKYLESIFKNNYQVWIENRALLTFQAGVQLQIAYLLGALLTCVIALTGILGFLNTSAISINGRKGEFAVLRSMGMTGGQLRKMLLLEGLFLSLTVIGLTAPFFVPSAPPALWISVYIIICLLLTSIPYMVYLPEQKKSLSKTLQDIL